MSDNPQNSDGVVDLNTPEHMLEKYVREMCAEVWNDEKDCWINPHERANHFWDCEVMLQALSPVQYPALAAAGR